MADLQDLLLLPQTPIYLHDRQIRGIVLSWHKSHEKRHSWMPRDIEHSRVGCETNAGLEDLATCIFNAAMAGCHGRHRRHDEHVCGPDYFLVYCAEHLSGLPDYQPMPDETQYPRENIRSPGPDKQDFGNAWAHKFLIRGSTGGDAMIGKSGCLKDCKTVAGVPQFYSSDACPTWTPSTGATVFTRLLDAGADIVGTATCEHFLNSVSSFTSAQGSIGNARQTDCSFGGIKSGGGVLVASASLTVRLAQIKAEAFVFLRRRFGRMLPFFFSLDAGNATRCAQGVGLKPTHGLVPWTGFTSGDAVEDDAGPVTRSVLVRAKGSTSERYP